MNTRSPTRLLPCLLVLVLFVTGCASQQPTPTVLPPDQPPPTAPAPLPLKLVVFPFVSHAPFHIALAEGYFAEQGLDVETVAFQFTTDAFPALVQGQVDVMAGLTTSGLINAIAGGVNLKIVADKGHISETGCDGYAVVARSKLLEDGTLTDYPWLVPGSPAGAPLLPGADEMITAAYDTAALGKGLHLGYLKFTDNCGSAGSYIRPIKLNVDNCITEPFDYMDGRLDTKPAWGALTACGLPSPIMISSNVLQITGGGATSPTITVGHDTIDNCPLCPDDGIHRVTFKIRGHIGGSRFWAIHVIDGSGNDLAAWRGTASQVDYGVAGFWIPFAMTLTGGSTFDVIEARINPHTVAVEGIPAETTAFYFNDDLVGTLDHTPAGDRVRGIQVVRVANDTSGDDDPVVEIDDLVVSRCSSSCNDPAADADADGDVDQVDFSVFQLCYTGPGGGPIPSDPVYCRCFDRGADAPSGDDDIDPFDLDAFEVCASGPGIAANPLCDDPM